MNGSLTATVAVCAGCDLFPSWAALLVGLVAGPVFIAADKLLLRLRIDDPVNAIPVNGVGGKADDAKKLISNIKGAFSRNSWSALCSTSQRR